MNNLNKPAKTYILSIIFGCLAFGSMNEAKSWTNIDNFMHFLNALKDSILEGAAYLIIIGIMSFIGYLFIDLWISDAKSTIEYNIKYVFVSLIAIIIVGFGFAQFV